MWRLTTTFTGNQQPIDANLEEVDTGGYVRLGAAVTESSGVFTLPSTGFWFIGFQGTAQKNSGTQHTDIRIESVISASADVISKVPIGFTNQDWASGYTSALFDCSNTSTHKLQFCVAQSNTANGVRGDSDESYTSMSFTRLADT